VIGKNFFDFIVPEDEKEQVINNLNSISQDNDLYIFTNKNILKNGKIIICEWHNTLIHRCSEDDEFEIVSLAIDITQRVEEEQLLKLKAHYDALTNLPNRHFFENILEKIHSLAQRNKTIFGIAFIDLDGFKSINDTYGHHAGDILLKTLAERFKSTIRQEDTIARLGGDEFAMIFHMSDENEPYQHIIERILKSASQPVKYTEDTTLVVSASIGISFYRIDNQANIKELLTQADNAMYEAKKKGKNCFSIYQETPY